MDDIAILYKEAYTVDKYGNEVKSYQDKQIYCQVRSTTMREFYQAAQAGLRPSVILTMAMIDYEGEKIVEWRGKYYGVLRSYWNQGDYIELSLEERTDLNGGLN